MKEDLKITLVQCELQWQNPQGNYDHISSLIEENNVSTDIIVLPEMYNSGFTMDTQLMGETMNGPSLQFLKDLSKESNAAVVASMIIEEEGKYYNRCFFCRPDGDFEYYNKRHLFRMAKENNSFQMGENKVIVTYKGWKILLQVCYDLRFPVWSRNVEGFDLILYVANWPEVRNHPWKTLLQARAIENLCYVAGVNRVGKDNNDISYSGDSVIIDPKGMHTYQCKPGVEVVETVKLSAQELIDFRKKFPADLDSDRFTIIQ